MTITRSIANLTRYEILAIEARPRSRTKPPRSSEAGRTHPMPSGTTSCHSDRSRNRIRLGPASLPVTSGIDHAQDVAGEFDMSYQIIDAVMARALQQDAARTHPLFAWIILQDLPEYPGALVARLVTDAPTPYILLGHTLAEMHASLPPGLARSERQPSDQPEVVEVWFPK
jgi:hypothetical protein